MIKSTDTMYSLINQNSTKYYISSKVKCSSIDWESNIVVTSEFLGSFEFPVRYFFKKYNGTAKVMRWICFLISLFTLGRALSNGLESQEKTRN